MPYTADTLGTYMSVELGATGVALGLSDGDDEYVEAVNEVAAVLGMPIASLTDDLKTRTVARWQAWRAARSAAAGNFDLKAGSTDLKRSQAFAHISLMLAEAESAASRYSEVADALAGGGMAYVTEVSTGGNPYQWPRDEWSS